MRSVSQNDYDDVRKKDSVLIVLGPHWPPVEEVYVRLLNDGDIIPLVTYDGIDAKVVKEPKISEHRKSEAQRRYRH